MKININVLLAMHHIDESNFKEHEIGKKYFERFKSIAESETRHFFAPLLIEEPSINYHYNIYSKSIKDIRNKTYQNWLVDVSNNINIMNAKRFDFVVFLDHEYPNPDPIVEVEKQLCDMLSIPYILVDYNVMTNQVLSENRELVANPIRRDE